MSKEADRGDVKSPVWQDRNCGGPPTLSLQMCRDTQEQGVGSSTALPVPRLCADGTEWCLGGEVGIETEQSR